MFGTGAEVDTDAGAVRHFVDEWQEFLEARRVGFLQGIGACRDEEIGVLEGWINIAIGRWLLAVSLFEGERYGAVDGFSIAADSL